MELDELLESWAVTLAAERKAPGTLRAYRTGVTHYLSWCDTKTKPRIIDRGQANAWIADMLAGGAEGSTASLRQTALRRFSAWLTSEGELDDDPLLGIKPPKLDQKVLEPLTEDELVDLFAACEGKRLRDRRDMAIIRTMAETSARAGEMIGMNLPDDVNLAGGVVILRKTKGGTGRMAGVGPKSAQALDRYIRIRRTHRSANLPNLWLGQRDTPLTYGGLWETLLYRAKIAGIERFHPHLLRHTAATRWLDAGGSEGGLMAQAGWTNRKMLDRYTRATANRRAIQESKRLNIGDL